MSQQRFATEDPGTSPDTLPSDASPDGDETPPTAQGRDADLARQRAMARSILRQARLGGWGISD